MKTRVALAIAIILAIIAALGLRNYMINLKEQQSGKQNLVTVLAAKRALSKGEPITGEEALEQKGVPENLVGPNHIQPHQQHRLVGMRPVVSIERGEVLLWSYFVSTTELKDEAGEKLKEGERAVTLKVDQISGVAGLVLPNSRVDVFGTFARQEPGSKKPAFYSRPLLYNVPVLAIDNQTSLLSLQADNRMRQGGYSSVTLAVKPQAARLLIFAQSQGQISLVLRKPQDAGVESVTEILTPENMDTIADRLLEEQRTQSQQGLDAPRR